MTRITRKIGVLFDEPGYVGGAEMSTREFLSAAPDDVEIVPVRPGQAYLNADAYIVFNCSQYSPDIIDWLQRAPVIKVVYDISMSCHPELRRWLLANATPIIMSPRLYDFVDWRFEQPPIYIPSPVDLTPFDAVAETNHREGAVWCGRYEGHKGLLNALKWAEVNASPLHFYGSGPVSLPNLKDDRGPYDHRDLPAILATYQQFVFLPETPDLCPRTIFEAWAAGLDIVTNDRQGATWWLEHRPEAIPNARHSFWFGVQYAMQNTLPCERCALEGENWSQVAIVNDAGMLAPCRRPDCGHAMQLRHDGTQEFKADALPYAVKAVNSDEMIPLYLKDDHEATSKIICWEVSQYWQDIEFKDDDWVIDIGAHKGIASIALAKEFPNVNIVAFEPVPKNHEDMAHNIASNGVRNINPVCMAVMGGSEGLKLYGSPGANTGSFTAYAGECGEMVEARSLTLEDIFSVYIPASARVIVKIDCEGAEYDILYNTPEDILSCIQCIVGEIHSNDVLRALGNDPHYLTSYLKRFIQDVRLKPVPILDRAALPTIQVKSNPDPLTIAVKDHQNKTARLVEALRLHGHIVVNHEQPADVLLIDLDTRRSDRHANIEDITANHREIIDQHADRGAVVLLYQHGATVMGTWAGLHEPYHRTDGFLALSGGHAEAMRMYGYSRPIHNVGWYYSDRHSPELVMHLPGRDPFDDPVVAPLNVLFAPMHPVQGYSYTMGAEHRRLNIYIYQELLRLSTDLTLRYNDLTTPPFYHDMTRRLNLTVRHMGPLAVNHLWEVPGVRYSPGVYDNATSDIQDADVVVATGSFAYMAVALGKPTVMFAQPYPVYEYHRSGRRNNTEAYADFERYPIQIDLGIKTAIQRAITNDPAVNDWRARFIDTHFDPVKFNQLIEQLVKDKRNGK